MASAKAEPPPNTTQLGPPQGRSFVMDASRHTGATNRCHIGAAMPWNRLILVVSFLLLVFAAALVLIG